MLMADDEVVCVHCRVHRDRDAEAELETVRQTDLAAKRRRKRVVAAAVALLAAVWLSRNLIAGAVGTAWKDFAAEVEKTRSPGHWKGTPSDPVVAPRPAPEVGVSSAVYLDPGSGGGFPSYPSDAPAPEPAPSGVGATVVATVDLTAPAVEPEILPSGNPDEVRVHGKVYDLATGLPVSGAMVRFMLINTESRGQTATDTAGRYQMGVSRTQNLSDLTVVTIEATGYRKGVLEDRDPPYRERSSRARADLIAETVESDLEPVPVRYPPSAGIVRLDLVLVPLAKK